MKRNDDIEMPDMNINRVVTRNDLLFLKKKLWIEALRLPALRSHVIPNPRSAAARDPTATPPSALGPAEPLVECRSPRGSPAAPRPKKAPRPPQ